MATAVTSASSYTPQLMQSSPVCDDAPELDLPILRKGSEPDQGFEEPECQSAPSSTSTEFDSADEESVRELPESRRPSQLSCASQDGACGEGAGTGDTVDVFELKLNEAMIAFRHLINNEYEEGYFKFCEMSDVSLYHLVGKLTVLTAMNLTSFKKHHVMNTLQEIKNGYRLINDNRKRRSATNAVTGFFRNVYNDYTDALDSACTVINDQSVSGAIRGAFKINVAHRTFKECERILVKKSNWTTDQSRDHFSSGVNLGLGAFELVISFFPHKFIKLLEFAGYCGDRVIGLEHLMKSEAIKTGFMHPWVSVLLSLYYGFLEYVYGLGEPDIECVRRIHDYYSQVAPRALAVTFGSAFFAQIRGDFDQAVSHYEEFVTGQSIVKTFHNLSYWQQIWLYAADCNWQAASILTKKMVDSQWKISPATFSYIHACFLSVMAEEGQPELREQATHYLRQVPKLKRNFGGKRAFHEKLVIEKSKQFADHPEKFVMAILDLMYIWNCFTLASYKSDCLPKLMAKIEDRLVYVDKEQDMDTYSRLIFMKGVCLAHGKSPLLAVECFYAVLDFEKFVRCDHHLAPQACYEIGLVYRRMGDPTEAKKWLSKCKNYHNYITETMINFRSQLAMQSLNESENKQ